MAIEKQYVFSARTSEEGLKALDEVKAKLNIGWDELVIEAVSAQYELDRAMMNLLKREKPAKETPAEQPPTEQISEERLMEAAAEEKPTEEAPSKKRKKGGKGK